MTPTLKWTTCSITGTPVYKTLQIGHFTVCWSFHDLLWSVWLCFHIADVVSDGRNLNALQNVTTSKAIYQQLHAVYTKTIKTLLSLSQQNLSKNQKHKGAYPGLNQEHLNTVLDSDKAWWFWIWIQHDQVIHDEKHEMICDAIFGILNNKGYY